jgi:hypothetical protein
MSIENYIYIFAHEPEELAKNLLLQNGKFGRMLTNFLFMPDINCNYSQISSILHNSCRILAKSVVTFTRVQELEVSMTLANGTCDGLCAICNKLCSTASKSLDSSALLGWFLDVNYETLQSYDNLFVCGDCLPLFGYSISYIQFHGDPFNLFRIAGCVKIN